MLRLLLHWHIHFIKGFLIQILSSLFRVTLGVCERAKGFSGKEPATTDFEQGFSSITYIWDLQFTIILNIAWLYTTLGWLLGGRRGPWGATGGLCPGAQVRMWGHTWWTKTQLGVHPHSSSRRAVMWAVPNSSLYPSPATWLPLQLVWGQAADTALSKAGGLSYGNEPIKGGYRGAQLASFLGWGSAIELKIERCWTGEFSAA